MARGGGSSETRWAEGPGARSQSGELRRGREQKYEDIEKAAKTGKRVCWLSLRVVGEELGVFLGHSKGAHYTVVVGRNRQPKHHISNLASFPIHFNVGLRGVQLEEVHLKA